MTLNRHAYMHIALITTLVLLALFLPLPLYLMALAIFGLPHIIWEMAFIRSRYAKRWPLSLWLALCIVLMIQAGFRGGLWLGTVNTEASQIADLLTLLLLFAVLIFAPIKTSRIVRIASFILAVLVWWLLDQGVILPTLLLLAILHNFTPLIMAWDFARDHQNAKPLIWVTSILFALPIFIAMTAWAGTITPASWAAYSPLLNTQLPQAWQGTHQQAILSAIVLAQCLHYYCVIYLLPSAEAKQIGQALISNKLRLIIAMTVGLLVTYYITDYIAARKLYALFAGAHAWLEWPVLLLAMLGASKNNHPKSSKISVVA